MKKVFNKQTAGELQSSLVDAKKTLRDLQLGLSKTKTKNIKETKFLKKDIARILTLINAAHKKA